MKRVDILNLNNGVFICRNENGCVFVCVVSIKFKLFEGGRRIIARTTKIKANLII